MSILSIQEVTLKFGGLTAVDSVSFEMPESSICSIIGPNGAGKTTLFNAVSGIFPPHQGSVFSSGVELKESLSYGVITKTLLIGLSSSVLAVLLFHCQSLWTRAIGDLYIYNQPFDWRNSLLVFLSAIKDILCSSAGLPALAAFILAALGYLANWQRSRWAPSIVTKRGIARTFQNIRLFNSLSVLDNLLIGMHEQYQLNIFDVLFHTKRFRSEESRLRLEAQKLLSLVGLSGSDNRSAAELSYGSKRRLEIARALALRPKLVMLDEPAAGMNPTELEELIELIRKIRGLGISVLLIEHHMHLVMKISDRVAVLEYGHKIAEGTPEYIQNDPQVIKAYLGTQGLDDA